MSKIWIRLKTKDDWINKTYEGYITRDGDCIKIRFNEGQIELIGITDLEKKLLTTFGGKEMENRRKYLKMEKAAMIRSLERFEKEERKRAKEMEKWLLKNYGERCKEYEPACVVCRVWKGFDLIFGGKDD